MTAARTVGAAFTIQRHALTVSPQPTNGTVTGTGITCGSGGSDCTETFNYNTVVALTATPATGYDFGSWTGACTGTGACSVTMTAARTVGATFTPKRYTLTVTRPTRGTITATGINCGTGGADCTQDYDYATVVAVTAVPDAGYRLRLWTGACTGTGACSLTMTVSRSVGGVFNAAFQGTKTGSGGYEGPGFVANGSEAAPAEATPTPAPVAPAERTGPSPAPAPDEPVTEPTPEIRPQAVASVPDAPRVLVRGEVRTPGAYAWFPGMTARQIVSLAGLPEGPEDLLAIVRETAGQGPGDEIELDALVTAGETILVRRRAR